MSRFRIGLAPLVGGLWLLAATPALAECETPGRDCAGELPSQCLQKLGAGAIAADDACNERYDAYLGCLDEVIASCEPEEIAVSPSCGEERETALWREARDSGTAEDLNFFLEVCPDSVFRRYAESRLAELETAEAADASAAANDAAEKEAARTELASLQDRREEVTAKIAEQKARGAVLEKTRATLLASLDLAKKNLERMEALSKRGVITQKAVDAARAKWAEFIKRHEALLVKISAQSALVSRARAELEQLDLDISSAKAAIGG